MKQKNKETQYQKTKNEMKAKNLMSIMPTTHNNVFEVNRIIKIDTKTNVSIPKNAKETANCCITFSLFFVFCIWIWREGEKEGEERRGPTYVTYPQVNRLQGC